MKFEDLLRLVEDGYATPKIDSFEPVAAGVSTANHILVAGDAKYFLKQYRAKFTPERVSQIHAAKQFFANGGIPAVLPLANKSGKTFFEHGGHCYTLFPFVEGTVVDRYHPEQAITSMATLEAKLHRLSEHGAPQIARQIDLSWDTAEFLEEAPKVLTLIESLPHDDFNAQARKTLELKVQLVEQSSMNYDDLGLHNDHLIHGDYHAENMFFTPDHQVKYLFDFEKTGLAPRYYELIRTVFLTSLNRGFKHQSIEHHIPDAVTYIRLYHKQYPITADEIRAGVLTRYYTDIHSLWQERAVFEQGNDRVRPLFKGDYFALSWLSEHLEELIKQLQQAIA